MVRSASEHVLMMSASVINGLVEATVSCMQPLQHFWLCCFAGGAMPVKMLLFFIMD